MILLISDYHKEEKKVLDLIKTYQPDHILCCGDGESLQSFYEENMIDSVRGNCDISNLPLIKTLEIDGMRILITHGHLYNVYFDLFKLSLLAKEYNVKYVFYGHTHEANIEEYDGVTFVNPGALKDGNFAIIKDRQITLM